MKIKSLSVSNFKSIKFAKLEDLPNMVVIAGPNGCGKSTLFDAIRLLKSLYGGYQPNEWQQWFSEFQISLDRWQEQLLPFFRDPQDPLIISALLSLSESEKEYIRNHLSELLSPIIWQQIIPESNRGSSQYNQAIASQLQQYGDEFDEKLIEESSSILKELDNDFFPLETEINPQKNERMKVKPSLVAKLIFNQFRPQEIGIIDYHGSQRSYQREQIGGVNLNIQTSEQTGSQNALYNYGNKYINIKSEMASSYVRETLAQKAGSNVSSSQSLQLTLQELFTTFFPGKKFKGIVPTSDGGIRFPVLTDSGSEHDINDLSSGEKEVLYGYLRLYNLRPQHSILLIDEPELHLNPRMVQGLPQFYQKHLGKPLDNQIWLLTHSDALLREALNTENAAIFHMFSPDTMPIKTNNVQRVNVTEEVDKAIIDLIGDLATYKPGAKVIIFEGGGEDEIDIKIVSILFPEYAKSLNFIHGNNKYQVQKLHALLEDTHRAGVFNAKVFSIVDKDTDDQQLGLTDNYISWDVYHIENYLLESEIIQSVVCDIKAKGIKEILISKIDEELHECAKEILPILINQELHKYAQGIVFHSLEILYNHEDGNPSQALSEAIERMNIRLTNLVSNDLTPARIIKEEEKIRQSLQCDLDNGNWRKTYKGRDILKRLPKKLGLQIDYVIFRNLIIAKMRDKGFKPEGMKDILEKILSR